MNKKDTAAGYVPRVYGVYGLMEWQALIPTRNKCVRVPFTGGALTGFGIRPATYTARNEVMAYFIEQSAWFKSGKIRRVK